MINRRCRVVPPKFGFTVEAHEPLVVIAAGLVLSVSLGAHDLEVSGFDN